jgi:hypothetical protein
LQPSKSAISGHDLTGPGFGRLEVDLLAGLNEQGGEAVSRVLLEPLTGRDEERLAQTDAAHNLPVWATRLLAEKVFWKGQPLGQERAAGLAIVDRDLLMLYLRMQTFGSGVRGVTTCGHKDCGVKLDFYFDLNAMTIPQRQSSGHARPATVAQAERSIRFSFREPDGRDQAVIADLAAVDPEQAWLALMAGCITEWDGQAGITAQTLAGLPDDVLSAVDQTLADEIYSLDWEIELACSECGRNFKRTLDIQAIFRQELQFCNDGLLEEVHQLAFYYHWSEADILNLTRGKRRLYLQYIQKEIQT